MMTHTSEKQWYFNTVTGEAELGPQSPISQRMGPYRTREDALDAWRIVAERNAAWEAQDRQWNHTQYESERHPDSTTQSSDAQSETH